MAVISLSNQMINFLWDRESIDDSTLAIRNLIDRATTLPLLGRIREIFCYYTPFFTSEFEQATSLIEAKLVQHLNENSELTLLTETQGENVSTLIFGKPNPFQVTTQNVHKKAVSLLKHILFLKKNPKFDSNPQLCSQSQEKAYKLSHFKRNRLESFQGIENAIITPLFRSLMIAFSNTSLSLENQTHYFAKFIHLKKDDKLFKTSDDKSTIPLGQKSRTESFLHLENTLNRYRDSRSYYIWGTCYRVTEFVLTYIPFIRSDWQKARDDLKESFRLAEPFIYSENSFKTLSMANRAMTRLVFLAQHEAFPHASLDNIRAPQYLKSQTLRDIKEDEMTIIDSSGGPEDDAKELKSAISYLFDSNSPKTSVFFTLSPVEKNS
ncbi:MAG: hypothetical protein P0S95_05830 [Rhabdochlamydiaceae bacterium]|nr:hypothetical protein [Candidatus Amphrikana amoebophyrae]